MNRAGHCYELAFEQACRIYMHDRQSGALLVHGLIRDTNLTRGNAVICHAWVVDGDMVWEPVFDSEMPVAVFMHMFDATEIHRYTLKEVATLAVETGHSGPWKPMPDHLQRVLDAQMKG